MTTPSLTIRRSSAIGSLLERLAWRVALSGARRIRFGPDGRPAGWNTRVFGDAAAAGQDGRRSRSTTVRRSCGCWSAARPVAARRTWTGSGPARIWRPCCGSPHGTASRWRCLPGWFRVPLQLRRTFAHRTRRNTRGGAPEHRGPLRPGQRLLPAVPRRDADVLLRGLRDARPDACGRAAEQVPADRGRSRAVCRPARPGDRERVGRLRAVRGGRARLPRDDDHDLARAARARNRAGSRSGTRASRRRPAARLPRCQRNVRRDRLDRDARGRRGGVPRDVLRDLRSGAAARRAPEPPGDHLSRRRLRAAVARANWIQTYIFPGGLCPSLAVLERQPAGRGCSFGASRTSRLRTC